MAREDVSVGGIVYYGYSLESPEDWSAGCKELVKKMNSAPVATSISSTEFTFRYSWMQNGNNVAKVVAADSERGLAYTIFSTGADNGVWAWISSSGTEDANSPNWSGKTSGSIWTTGINGVSTTASAISLARISVIPSASSGKKATAMYLMQSDGSGVYVFPNDMASSFTPFKSTISGSPESTQAKITVMGPVHSPYLAGRGSPYAMMPTIATQVIPPGSYNFSGLDTSGKIVDWRLQGVMAGSDGNSALFMMADTGASAYDDEE